MIFLDFKEQDLYSHWVEIQRFNDVDAKLVMSRYRTKMEKHDPRLAFRICPYVINIKIVDPLVDYEAFIANIVSLSDLYFCSEDDTNSVNIGFSSYEEAYNFWMNQEKNILALFLARNTKTDR